MSEGIFGRAADRQALQIDSSGGAAFVLHSRSQFPPSREGLLILQYTKSAAEGGYASLYEVASGGRGPPQAVQMVKPISPTIDLGNPGAGRRYGEIYLIPMRPGRRYGVYIFGQGEESQSFGDWAVHFLPF